MGESSWSFPVPQWQITDLISRFSATVPGVIEELGYSSANAQLLTVPVYVFAVICVLITAFWSDRAQVRWIFILVPFCVAAMGFIVQLAIPHPRLPGLTYGFLFPIAGGMYAGFPPLLSWLGKTPPWMRTALTDNVQRTTLLPLRSELWPWHLLSAAEI